MSFFAHPTATVTDAARIGEGTAIWHHTHIREGSNIGAVCGVTIGRWALVGAGAVVTADVADHGLAYGNPARHRGLVCACGASLPARRSSTAPADETVTLDCTTCGRATAVAAAVLDRIDREAET